MDLPDEKLIESNLSDDKSRKKLKGSRIDKALNKMREEMKERSEKGSSSGYDMTLTSKSKLLAQMQIKSEKLEVMQTSSNYNRVDEFGKTVISDQMVDRLQESANKRERIARENKERMQRHDDGY